VSPSGLPVDVEAELRGVQPAGSFVARETGELVNTSARAKFEYELPDGDVGTFELSQTQFDKATGNFDFNTAKRGDRVRVVGTARGGERGVYLQLVLAESVKQAPRTAA
jgi:hypothetical protein